MNPYSMKIVLYDNPNHQPSWAETLVIVALAVLKAESSLHRCATVIYKRTDGTRWNVRSSTKIAGPVRCVNEPVRCILNDPEGGFRVQRATPAYFS